MTIAFVVTTIQTPTAGIRRIADEATKSDFAVYVIGDEKSPEEWFCPGVDYLGVQAQRELSWAVIETLPFNTYARKLVGYLLAAAAGADWIRETDDDNAPYDAFFAEVPNKIKGRTPELGARFINIYRFFTNRHIWPRGLPLNRVNSDAEIQVLPHSTSGLVVLQSVADGDPDVDAVYRLTAQDTTDVAFAQEPPLIVPPGIWAPFNSQATTWPRQLLPLMYLPSTCSFRMTDIWRSYVAQRLMPGLGATLVITGPTVYQDRNKHDLMRDFRDEIEGYVGYEHFVDTLEQTAITGGFDALLSDLRSLYVALVNAGFFTSEEMPILDAWIADMESLGFGLAA